MSLSAWTITPSASTKLLTDYSSDALINFFKKYSDEAYNNYFNGDSKNAPGYFEAVGGPSFVKYNTFNNVTLFAYEEKANQLVFDNNLYF